MLQNKRLKAGAAIFLSTALLIGCGDEEMDVVPEEDQNTETESNLDLEQDDAEPEEDLETDMDPNLETDEDSESN